MPSTSGKQRTKEDVVKEIAKLDEAQTRIGSRIEEIATQIATGTKEQREEREKSLRKGYPAKASQSQRELRLEQQDLQDQLGDLARMRARLQLEEVGLDLAAVVELRDQYVAEVNELEGPHRELTEKLEAARARAQNTRSHESGLREARSRAEATLYQLDSDYREKIEREIDERRRREEEGMKRQREERTREFAAAVDESNKEQGIGISDCLRTGTGRRSPMMQDEPLPDARARLQPPRVQNTDTPAHLRGLGVTPSQIALLRQIEEKSEEDGEASFSSLVGPDPRSAAVLYSRLLSLESQFLVRFSWRENPRNEWDNRVQFIHLTEWGRDVLLSWLEEEYAESG